MVDVWLPYGKSSICVRVPARNLLGIIEPKEVAGVSDPEAEVKRAEERRKEKEGVEDPSATETKNT